MIDKYGADALRYTLIMGNSPGNDMRFSEDDITAYRNFANKIWNAARFAMNYLTIDKVELPEKLEIEDEWILSAYNYPDPSGKTSINANSESPLRNFTTLSGIRSATGISNLSNPACLRAIPTKKPEFPLSRRCVTFLRIRLLFCTRSCRL